MSKKITEFVRCRFPTANGITQNVLIQWLRFITTTIHSDNVGLQSRYKMVYGMICGNMEFVEMIFNEYEFIRSFVFCGSYEIARTDLEYTPLSTRLTISEIELGSGGYGSVWDGIHNDCAVAVKRFHKTNCKKDFILQDTWFGIFKELAILQKLQTTQVIGCGWVDNSWVIVMQKHQIKSFKWKKHALYSSQTMTDVIQQLFSAMDYFHNTTGYVHGDVKPENIMIDIVDAKPVVKIIDFGLSEPIQFQIRGHQNIQTIYWRSPELLEERMCDLLPTDIWATAVSALDIMLGSIIFTKMGVGREINEREMLYFIQDQLKEFPKVWETWFDADMLKLARMIYKKFLVYDPSGRAKLSEFYV